MREGRVTGEQLDTAARPPRGLVITNVFGCRIFVSLISERLIKTLSKPCKGPKPQRGWHICSRQFLFELLTDHIQRTHKC